MTTLRFLVGLGFSFVFMSVAMADTYSQNFDGFADGTTDLGDGSVIGSNDGTASIQGGALRLTLDLVTSTRASFRLPPIGSSSDGWTMSFDFFLFDSPGANAPADGFSMTYGVIPEPGSGPQNGQGNSEEGFGGGSPQLSIEVDTWQLGDAEHGYTVAVNGNDVPDGLVNTDILLDGATVNASATIVWDPVDGVTFTVDTGDGAMNIFTKLPTPGFTADDSHTFAFSARTGGATETLTIDNLNVQTALPPVEVPAVSPAGIGVLLSLFLVLGAVVLGRKRRLAASH